MILTNILKEVEPKLSNWWENNDQEQPLVLTTCLKENADIPDTDDLDKYWNNKDFVIERQIKTIDQTNYYGVAIPMHFLDYGSSAMSCALGAKIEYLNKETIWAHPSLNSLEEFLELKLDKSKPVYGHFIEMAKSSAELSPNHHYIAHFPLQGALDMLADMYGIEKLLTDLLLDPEMVKKAGEHAFNIWKQGFDDINQIVSETGNYGSIGWAGVWAPGSTFPIQEDFSYMISNEMFVEFCLPHIINMVEYMEYPFYHLDGVGALNHLDSLLDIDRLKVIQWQPGAGKEKLSQWYDLIKRILVAGKSVQLYGEPEEIDDLVKNVGAQGLLVICRDLLNEQAEKLEEKYC